MFVELSVLSDWRRSLTLLETLVLGAFVPVIVTSCRFTFSPVYAAYGLTSVFDSFYNFVLFDISTATPASFPLSFAWNIFFLYFTFDLCVDSAVKRVSRRLCL